MNFKGIVKKTVFGLCLILATNIAFAETKNDAQTIEEVTKFCEESSKMREDHIREMRDLHIKQINETYERKMAHNKEMTELWKQFKPGDKAANKALKAKIKEKQEANEKEEQRIKEDFKENVMKKKHKEFRELMKARQKEMKGKFKE